MTFAILIPALDEEGALARVLADLPRAGDTVPLADGGSMTLVCIVVVDNGSRDRTAQVARDAGAEVVPEPRRGYGQACLAGLAWLAKSPPDVVVFLDADHSDDPRELPLVLAPIAAGRADLVIGSRVLGAREPGAFTAVQAFGNRLSAWLMKWLWGASFTDLGPFRAIAWEVLTRLRMRDRDYGWTVEMQTRALQQRVDSTEVAVSYRRRRLGRSKITGTFRGILGAGTKILWTIARVRLGG